MGILSSALQREVENQTDLTAEITLGGEKYKVGSKPLTPSDFSYVNKYVAEEAKRMKMGFVPFQQDPTNFIGMVMMIIRKTRMMDGDELGDLAFAVADKPWLMKMGVDVISGIFADLFGSQVTVSDEDEDDAEKEAAKN